jgi:aspartyl-tRNA(Asn)/glutamyl-tRNA(Gln) amidotransferase subunit A
MSTDGLPIGLQLMSRPWEEATMLRMADAYEAATPWQSLTPVIRSLPDA